MQTITIQLQNAPKAMFQPLDMLPKDCEHRIPFGDISLLADRGTDSRILCQGVSGWQFELSLYRCRCRDRTPITLTVNESRVFFLYALNGVFHYRTPNGGRHSLSHGNYVAIYLPKGKYRLTLSKPHHTLFGFSLPYGYLIWLTRHYAELAGLADRWKLLPNELFALPTCKLDGTIWRTFAQIKSCPKRGTELDGALKVYLARLVTRYATQLAEQRLSAAEKNEVLSRRVAAYLQEHYHEADQISAEALMQQFQISDTHMRRIFQETYGITIREYIQTLRVDAGKELLRTTKLTLAEIAAKVGYEYTDSFIRLFKKQVGISPSVYRRQHV